MWGGMTGVINPGGIEFSFGSVYALASVAGAIYMNQFGSDGSPWMACVGVLVTVGVGLLCGFCNGLMTVGFNVHPFIITLGTMAIYRGIAFVSTNGQSIGDFPQSFRDFVRQGVIGDLSLVPLIVMILVCVVGGIFLARLTTRRRTFTIGAKVTPKSLMLIL